MNPRYVPLILAGLALMCLVAMGTIARAQGAQCGPRADMLSHLKDKFHEEVTWFGLIDSQTMELLTMSPERTWTRIRTNSAGMACIISSGEEGQFDTTAFDNAKKGEAM
jgi:hypothetical protein